MMGRVRVRKIEAGEVAPPVAERSAWLGSTQRWKDSVPTGDLAMALVQAKEIGEGIARFTCRGKTVRATLGELRRELDSRDGWRPDAPQIRREERWESKEDRFRGAGVDLPWLSGFSVSGVTCGCKVDPVTRKVVHECE